MAGTDPLKAHKKHPAMGVYDAWELEINKPRNRMIGLRVTEDDMRILERLAKKKGATVTQVAYIILRRKIMEL